MLRKDMLSFEEMDKREGLVDTDEENICYRIEDHTSWIREKAEKKEDETSCHIIKELTMVQHMDLSVFDIMYDCYDAKRIGSYKTEVYYSNNDNKIYEITYDCKDFRIVEINRREAEPGEADKKHFLDDIKDYLIIAEGEESDE